MFKFTCAGCSTEIQADYSYAGERVNCPICSSPQIVPDLLMAPETEFHGYRIKSIIKSSLLFNTYLAEGKGGDRRSSFVVRVPTTFFLKRVSNLNGFSSMLIKTGSLGIQGLPRLIDRSTMPGKTFWVYDHLPNSYMLESCVNTENPMEIDYAVTVAKNISDTLSKVWKKEHMPHQSLCPSNIILGDDWSVQILNIGLSNFLLQDQHLLKHGFTIWDYRYMSPEFMSQGMGSTPSVDIYALGGILYFMSTGYHPFDGIEPSEIMNAPDPDPRKYKPGFTEGFARLVSKLMEKNPSRRPSSWEDVNALFDKYFIRQMKGMTVTQLLKKYAPNKEKKESILGATGHFAEGFGKVSNIRRKKDLPRPPADAKMEDTIAKLAPLEIETKATTGRLKKEEMERRILIRNRVRAVTVAFCSVLFVVGMLALIYYSGKKAKSEIPVAMPAENINPVQETEPATGESKEETAPSAQAQSSALPSEVRKQKNQPLILGDELAAVEKYFKDNPQEFEEVVRQYEKLIPEAVRLKRFDIVETINKRIDGIYRGRDALVSEKLDELKKTALSLVAAGKPDEALTGLKDYSGTFAEETRDQRLKYSEEIKIKLAEEKVKKDELSAKKEEGGKMLRKFLFPLVPGILAGDTAEAEAMLKTMSESPDYAPVSTEINEIIDQLALFDKVRGETKTAKTAEQVFLSSGIDAKSTQPLFRGLVYSTMGEGSYAEKEFEQIPFKIGEDFVNANVEMSAASSLRKLLGTFDFTLDCAKPESFLLELTQKTISKDEALKLSSQIEAYSLKFKSTAFYEKYAHIVEAVRTYVARITGQKVATESSVSVEKEQKDGKKAAPGDTLVEAVESAKSGQSIKIEPGKYVFNKIILNHRDLTLEAPEPVLMEGSFEISGAGIKMKGIRQKKGAFALSSAKNIEIEDCFFEDSELKITSSERVTFRNCLFLGVSITGGKDIRFRHCVFLSPKRGIEASLRIDCESLEISDSIIYGEKYAVLLLKDSSAKGRYLHHNLWFGETGISALQAKDGTVPEKNIATKEIKVKRNFKVKANVYSPPQFVNSIAGDYRLVPGVPGTGKAEDGKDCGIIWPPKE